MPHLNEIAHSLLETACQAENGRAAEVLVNDGPLRQTLIALSEGTHLGEHNSPPAASMLVLEGSVQITGEEAITIGPRELHALTHHRHGVEALKDTVFLLTTVTSVPGSDSHA